MTLCYLITAAQNAATTWDCSSVVSANPILIYGGTYSGKYAVTCDFLSPEVVAGSPDNEALRAVLEAFPVVEIDLENLHEPEGD